jgi:hypothetical protein
MNTFVAAVAVFLISAFCLCFPADPAFAEDRKIVIPFGGDGRALAFSEDEPLNQKIVDSLIAFYEWMFGARMTPAQRQSFQRELSRSWDADKKMYLLLLVLSEKVDLSSVEERERIRREQRPRLATMYREGTEMHRIVESLIRSSGEPAADAGSTSVTAGKYAGNYTAAVTGGRVLLELQQTDAQDVTGRMQGLGGMTFQIRGAVAPGGRIEGIAHSGQGKLLFTGQLTPAGLQMVFAEPDAAGRVNLATARQLQFTRAGAGAGAPASSAAPPAPVASQNHLVQGMYCSHSGSSGYSRSTRAYFDGQGLFRYSGEAYSSGPSGRAYGSDAGSRGRYRVQGNQVALVFSDGSSGTARVFERAANGAITAVQYEGTIYARVLCD